jgi:hypothetical protein
MTRRCRTRLLAAAVLLLSGCALWGLHEDVTRLEKLALVGGHVSRAPEEDAPIVVVLLAGARPAVIDSFVLERSGAYYFTVPAGTYRIAAFVDRHRDLVYQPDTDPAGVYGAPTEVRVADGQKVGNLDLRIDAAAHVRLDFPISAADVGVRGTKELPPIELGEVVTLDDPRFAPENGDTGLWRPVEFLFDVGAGFYLLEPFDPGRMPVLFVHGSGGTPRDWRYIIEHLDRRRFQPWVLYYPSGVSLETAGRGGARWLRTLAVRYGIRHLIVVAHSMGGLVSRRIINEMVASGDGGMPTLFVTLSTPWGGYGAAARGARQSPVVMPMWRDIAPGSPFLAGLFRNPLPPGCPYHLLFSYEGHSLLLDEPNDGVVALSSELAPPAQHAAQKVYGFPESHVGILSSAEVSQRLNTLLADAAR